MNYDIIVVGSGSGGLRIAESMNKSGFKVLLIDKYEDSMGGDNVNYGSIPSNALIHISRLVHAAQQATYFGLKEEGKIDWKRVTDYITQKKNIIREHEHADYFRKQGIDVEIGSVRFVSPDTIEVSEKIHSAKKIILAPGSTSTIPNIKGIEIVHYLTNETIFNLEELPENVVVIGGGPRGVEFAQAFRRLGSNVTLVQRRPHFLPRESPEIADILMKQLLLEGVKLMFNTTPIEFSSPHELLVQEKNGKKSVLPFNALLVCTGRALAIDGLGLEKAGIQKEGENIKVNEYCQTTNKQVYVCGDATGAYLYTQAAELHADIIMNNFFSPKKLKCSYDTFSWVTFTDPEIATFGLNAIELNRRGIPYKTIRVEFSEDDRAIVDNYTNGLLLLYVSKNKIIGGSMIGRNAGELAQELILANACGLPLNAFFHKIYPYPTGSRVNKKAFAKHVESQLTPIKKRLLKMMY